MTTVPVAGLDDLNDVEDVALLVALAETFSFEPVRLAAAAPTPRRAGLSLAPARTFLRSLLGAVGRLFTVLTALVSARPHVRMPRRRRVRRYAVQPIILEGPRRVPIEVLHLSRPSSD